MNSRPMTAAVWSSVRSISGRLSTRAATIACTLSGTSFMSGMRRQPVGTGLAGEMAAFGELADQFLDEERIAARPVGDQRQQWRDRLIVAQQMGCQLVGGALAQRATAKPGRSASPLIHGAA